MTVGDLIAELRTLPRAIEVWVMIEDTVTTIDEVRCDGETAEIVGEDP